MLVRRTLPAYKPPFYLDDFWVVLRRSDNRDDHYAHKEMQAEAMVKVRVPGRGEGDDRVIQTAADGDGPVDALSDAVRKALKDYYPAIDDIRLVDYKVRVVDSNAGTGASVRVLIECVDEEHTWQCVGASTDIIEASWLALADAFEWWMLRNPG
jgi:2-isopropylmalate synthase